MKDRKTVLMPDRRGNNRLDTLRTSCETRAYHYFSNSSVRETLRINGHAAISVDPALSSGLRWEASLREA